CGVLQEIVRSEHAPSITSAAAMSIRRALRPRSGLAVCLLLSAFCLLMASPLAPAVHRSREWRLQASRGGPECGRGSDRPERGRAPARACVGAQRAPGLEGPPRPAHGDRGPLAALRPTCSPNLSPSGSLSHST